MNIRSRIEKSRYIAYTAAACTAVILYVALINIRFLWAALGKLYYFISPLVQGVIVAYLLNPVADFFSDRLFKGIKIRRLARGLAVTITITVLALVLLFLTASIVPQLIDSLNKLAGNTEDYILVAKRLLLQIQDKIGPMNINIDRISEAWDSIAMMLAQWLPNNLNTILSTTYKIGTGLFNSIVVMVIAIYLLLDKQHLMRSLKRLFMALMPEHTYNSLYSFLKHSNRIFIRYIGSDFLDGLIIGAANFLFLLIFKMPYPLLIAVISGLANLVPTFGPIAGTVPCALIILLVSPSKAVWFIVWTVLIQTVDAYVIKPLLFGDAMELAPVWVLVSIIVGGRVLGFVGILIGIPTAAILSVLLRKFISHRLSKRNIGSEES